MISVPFFFFIMPLFCKPINMPFHSLFVKSLYVVAPTVLSNAHSFYVLHCIVLSLHFVQIMIFDSMV